MEPSISEFEFAYTAGDIHYGQRCVSDLEEVMADHGFERALIVCGRTVGSTPAVINPVRDGIGDRFAGIFDRTVPSKDLAIVRAGVKSLNECDADVLIGVGGGSSLDIAKAIAIIDASDRSYEDIVRSIESTGTVPTPPNDPIPLIAVPTTLAGADLSTGVSVTLGPDYEGATEDGHQSGGCTDERLMPTALFYDPSLVATTPPEILASSAMNGFDKGIEMVYSRNATPITDATATHGLNCLRRGLPDLRTAQSGDTALHNSIIGTILVQYGLSSPGAKKLSVIHAFGHAISRHYAVQQGTVHGIIAPHALRLIFDHVDGRRDLLAAAFEVDTDPPDALASGVVTAVASIRDALGLPDQLRSVPDLNQGDLSAIAEQTLADTAMQNRPQGFDPSQEAIESTLTAAW